MSRSRETKVGIDYFSHDVDMRKDPKIRLLVAKHNLIGYAVYMCLLEELYHEKGYYYELSEDVNILFSNDINISLNDYIDILSYCIEKGLFNAELYQKYNILTSQRIQLNYISATQRRKEVTFFREFLLVDLEDKYKHEKVNVNILSYNVNNRGLKVNSGTQSKVKYSKVKNKNIYVEDSDEFQLAKYLYFWIKKNNPNAKEPNYQTWAKSIDLMIRVDNRKPDDIKAIIEFSQKHAFWQANILSTKKLREKYDALWIQKNKQPKGKKQFEEREYSEEEIDKLLWRPNE